MFLTGATSTYNQKVNDVTGFSPFEMIHSFKFFSPAEIELEVTNVSNVNRPDFEEVKRKKIRAIEVSRERIRKCQDRYARIINAKHKLIFLNIGDKVMYKNNTRSNFEFSWIGPWLVIERQSWVDHKIQLIEDSNIKRLSNIEHLKLFYSRAEQFIDTNVPSRFDDYFYRNEIPDEFIPIIERGDIFEQNTKKPTLCSVRSNLPDDLGSIDARPQ